MTGMTAYQLSACIIADMVAKGEKIHATHIVQRGERFYLTSDAREFMHDVCAGILQLDWADITEA